VSKSETRKSKINLQSKEKKKKRYMIRRGEALSMKEEVNKDISAMQ
jgi:hypothetical protein